VAGRNDFGPEEESTMRWFRFAFVAACLAAPLGAQDSEWHLRLEEAVSRAVANNPSVAEMEYRIQAARHRAGQSAALPDPEIEVGVQDIPPSDFSFTRDDFTMTKVTARQTFPAAGKRPARAREAGAAADAAAAEHLGHVAEIAADAADAYFALADLDARIAILDESRRRLERAAASASERYRVGKGAQTDVLRASLETTSVENRRVALTGERRMLAARLNALQDLPPDTAIARVPLPDADPSVPPEPELVASAGDSSPAIAAALAREREASEGLALARLERRPDVTTMGYYAHRVRYEDLVGASVAVNLPFFQPRRLADKQAELEAEASGARATVEMRRNEIRRGIAEAYAELDRSLEQERLYRGSILPQADTNERAAQEAYTVGQVDFLTYVRAALDHDAYAAELAARRASAWRAVAALQRVSGLPLVPGTPKVGEP
jgi:outer membrane protein TolC